MKPKKYYKQVTVKGDVESGGIVYPTWEPVEGILLTEAEMERLFNAGRDYQMYLMDKGKNYGVHPDFKTWLKKENNTI